MKRQISLKWFVALSFLGLAIVLVIGYSLLSAHFFVRGMDNIVAGNMHQVVESYVAALSEEQRRDMTTFSGYQISRDWQQMPEEIRRAFTEPVQAETMYKYDGSGWFQPPDKILFVMRSVTSTGESYFISRSVSRSTAPPQGGRMAARSMRLLLTLSLCIALLLAIIIWLLIKQVARPVGALGRWARSLNEKNLHTEPPDFSYPELNELAKLIRASLSSVQEALEREHRFLRHSSHELRTPISVIRNNVELLHKLRDNRDNGTEMKQLQAVERIDRASRTMKYLTETLLWLSREAETDLPRDAVRLDLLLRELIEEQNYLLTDKEIDLQVTTSAHTAEIQAVPARIVLGNLIRNAFQHTWSGTITLEQQQGSIVIGNSISENDDTSRDLGFGLGLQLTEQLSERMHWPYSRKVADQRYLVAIELK